MSVREHDLVVIGAGPGGYVAAIRAAQLGLNVGCVERELELGGTCLRIGCIPSKALLESSRRYTEALHAFARHGVRANGIELDLAAMLRHKDQTVKALTRGVAQLFQKNRITRYTGHGRIAGPGRIMVAGPGSATEQLRARHVIIATGSEPASLKGAELDGDRAGTSTEALSYPEVPGHLVVVGAGAIGLEMGSVWARLGARVTVLEYLPRILAGMDGEIAAEAQQILAKQGLEFRLNARVTRIQVRQETVSPVLVECQDSEPISCDRALVATGRVPVTRELGLETVGIELDPGGRIPVDDGFATRAPGFYAIGDVIAGPMLAHKAEDEGVACVEKIVTGYGHVNYQAIPSVVYTHPEVAAVGMTEEALKEAGTPYRSGTFPFRANGRARAMGDLDGRVKILAHATTDRVLGAHIVGPQAGDLIAELAMAIEYGASSEDVARLSHAHPSLAEVVREAALGVQGRTIHI